MSDFRRPTICLNQLVVPSCYESSEYKYAMLPKLQLLSQDWDKIPSSPSVRKVRRYTDSDAICTAFGWITVIPWVVDTFPITLEASKSSTTQWLNADTRIIAGCAAGTDLVWTTDADLRPRTW
jgi:hypothetical protein